MVNPEVLVTLQQIEAANGALLPNDVLEHARNPQSVLHGYFTWDNGDAGEKFRLIEAGRLISTVKVEIMGRQTNAFLKTRVVVYQEPRDAYLSTEKVLNDAEQYEAVKQRALAEIANWQKKYDHIVELHGLVNGDMLGSMVELPS